MRISSKSGTTSFNQLIIHTRDRSCCSFHYKSVRQHSVAEIQLQQAFCCMTIVTQIILVPLIQRKKLSLLIINKLATYLYQSAVFRRREMRSVALLPRIKFILKKYSHLFIYPRLVLLLSMCYQTKEFTKVKVRKQIAVITSKVQILKEGEIIDECYGV